VSSSDVEQLGTEVERFSRLARTVDHAASIAHLPDWTARHVIAHVVGDYRWASGVLETGRAPRGGFGLARSRGQRLCDVFDTEAARHLGLLATADPSQRCWNFADGDAGTYAWWPPHQLYETVLHRWDLETPTGRHDPIPAALAVDAIDEMFRVYTARYARQRLDAPVLLVCRDQPAAWRISPAARGRVTIERASHDDATGSAPDLAASAADLLLLMWHRITPDHPGVTATEVARRFVNGPLSA
jgi:uncharacterized protein (TIGR03083 family)